MFIIAFDVDLQKQETVATISRPPGRSPTSFDIGISNPLYSTQRVQPPSTTTPDDGLDHYQSLQVTLSGSRHGDDV